MDEHRAAGAYEMDGPGQSRDEIVALLFKAAMSGDVHAFARENDLDVNLLRTWRLRYLEDYARYLEAVLYKIQDQIDY
jgi:transposase-like protein